MTTGLNVVKELTPTLDTAIYAANDVLFVPTELKDVGAMAGGVVSLRGLMALDEADQTAFAFDLVFFRSNVTLGTINAAVSITDANASEIVGVVKVLATDIEDLVNGTLYFQNNLNVQMKLAANTTSLWVAAILRSGTPTFAASSMKLKLAFTQD